ncbi:type II secretion system protein J [Candidatus Hydrogenedentota bacterium]
MDSIRTNRSGFTLIEIIIAAGIMVAISLLTIHVIVTVNDASQLMEKQVDLQAQVRLAIDTMEAGLRSSSFANCTVSAGSVTFKKLEDVDAGTWSDDIRFYVETDPQSGNNYLVRTIGGGEPRAVGVNNISSLTFQLDPMGVRMRIGLQKSQNKFDDEGRDRPAVTEQGESYVMFRN